MLLTVSVGQWILIGVVVLLIIAYPILMSRKNKRENEKLIEQTNSLKRGDKILTTSGVYGTILEVREEDGAKKVVIETGNDKYKSYMTVDAYAIYTVIKDEKEVEKKENVKVEEKKDEKKEEVVEAKVEEKVEVKEEKAPAKKETKAKTTKKTTTKKETKKN